MLFRSRLRRGISLEVIFEEECLRPGRPGAELAGSPERPACRAPSLTTLTELDDGECSSAGGSEEDEFHCGAGGISRRQILGLAHLGGGGSGAEPPAAADGAEATRRWVAAHAARRRPRTVGALRARHRGTDILGQYRLADLLVNDNIIIVDTSPPPPPVEAGAGGQSQDGADRADGAPPEAGGELPPPQTVRRVADRFERLARAEPDGYLLWRDTARLSGIRANPSSKILRSDTAGHSVLHEQLHELFRARRAAAAAAAGDAGDAAGDSGAEVGSAGAEPARPDSDSGSECGSGCGSGSGSDSALSAADGGVRPISAEALAAIRRCGVSVTYHGPRGGRAPSRLAHLVAEARRQPAFVAVAGPRVVGAQPKHGAHTLPLRRTARPAVTGSGPGGPALPAAAATAAQTGSLRARRPPSELSPDWRQTGRCYVFDFSQRSGHQPPPVQLRPRTDQS